MARVVAGCTLAMLVIAWPPLLVSVLALPMGLSVAELGAAMGVFFGTAAVLSPVGAATARRLGPVACLRTAVALTIVVGLVLATMPGVSLLLPALVVAGAANALVQPSTNAIIRGALVGPPLGIGLGIVQAAVPLTAVASAAVIPIVASGLGWRAGFGFLAAAAAVALGLLAVTITGRLRAVPSAVTAPRPTAVPRSEPRRILPFAAIALLGAMAASACSSFAVTSGSALGLSSTHVAGWLAAAGATCAGVRIVGTRAASIATSRPGTAGTAVIAVLLGSGLVGYLGLVGGSAAVFGPSLVVAYGFGWAWNGPLNVVTGAVAPSATVATGWTQAGVFGGSALGPVVFAAIVSGTGGSHVAGWAVCCACVSVAGVVTVGLLSGSRRVRSAVSLGP